MLIKDIFLIVGGNIIYNDNANGICSFIIVVVPFKSLLDTPPCFLMIIHFFCVCVCVCRHAN